MQIAVRPQSVILLANPVNLKEWYCQTKKSG